MPSLGRSAITGQFVAEGETMVTEYDDEDLREWAERIWAAVEYRGDGIRALKSVLAEIEERA